MPSEVKKSKPSYDSKCLELAEYFLSDVDGTTGEQKSELAQAIQDVCEDFCRDVARGTEAYMSRVE
jgi:hypothetical protein